VVKKQKNEPKDKHLFREQMTGVIPLKTPPVTDSRAPRPVNHGDRPEDYSENANPSVLLSTGKHARVDTDNGSSHRKDGIQKRTMQKLKRGQFKTGDELDLHNMRTETARTVLLEFIDEAQRRSLSSVRIIHGKGLRSENGPRLKLMTRQLLRNHPQVLAYVSCKPADGGDGAVDVLLKSS
jgi:DNA-nicking Smr family endonuclease